MSKETKERPRLALAGTDPVATGRPAPEPPREPPEDAQEDLVQAPTPPVRAPASKVKRASRKKVASDEPRGITFWVEPDVFKTLKQMCLNEDKSMREIMTEAVADYLRKKRQLSIVKSPPPKA